MILKTLHKIRWCTITNSIARPYGQPLRTRSGRKHPSEGRCGARREYCGRARRLSLVLASFMYLSFKGVESSVITRSLLPWTWVWFYTFMHAHERAGHKYYGENTFKERWAGAIVALTCLCRTEWIYVKTGSKKTLQKTETRKFESSIHNIAKKSVRSNSTSFGLKGQALISAYNCYKVLSTWASGRVTCFIMV